MQATVALQRALISVSDKTGIVDFARALSERGVEIVSTGGTFRLLEASGIPVTEVSVHTGFPEMMDGRVKTLHPRIHGGILGRRDQDRSIMDEHDIPPVDLVVVNLYPFAQVTADPDCDLPTAIENIDIGGPAMVRSAAKNHAWVTVTVDKDAYGVILDEMDRLGGITQKTRFKLARQAFEHTAAYDGMIANYLGSIDADADQLTAADRSPFPRTLNQQWAHAETLRYGENPHQKAAFYREPGQDEASISTAEQLQGKALSFNNIADSDAALECVKSFDAPACVIVKHANPCGVAVADSILGAYDRAFATDPTSAFGGIIAFNRPLDADTAAAIIDRQFVEVIIAPVVSDSALAALKVKPNVRVLASGEWDQPAPGLDFKRVTGGLLVQDRDLGAVTDEQLTVVTARQPSPQERDDLLFAWRVAKTVKSNAIVYARDLQTIGVGAGQMSRVYSARIAGIKAADAGLEVVGSVMASDAFLPFRDGLDQAAEAGIRAVIQPGGSIRDNEVIAAADEHNIAMVFTGMRHFRH